MGKRGAVGKNKLPTSNKPVPVRIVSNPVNPVDMSQSKASRDWQAREALRDIQRAEQHKSDKDLMGRVKQIAKQDMATLKKVCD
jgi:hypothetical protein